MGIGIIAEIFMGAIEKITAKKVVKTATLEGGKEFSYEVDFWNPTVANLTLSWLKCS